MADGAIYPWSKSTTTYYEDLIKSVCAHYSIDAEKPFKDLTETEQNILLYGSNEDIIQIQDKGFWNQKV